MPNSRRKLQLAFSPEARLFERRECPHCASPSRYIASRAPSTSPALVLPSTVPPFLLSLSLRSLFFFWLVYTYTTFGSAKKQAAHPRIEPLQPFPSNAVVRGAYCRVRLEKQWDDATALRASFSLGRSSVAAKTAPNAAVAAAIAAAAALPDAAAVEV